MYDFQVAHIGESVEGVGFQVLDSGRQVEHLDVAQSGEGGCVDADCWVVCQYEQAQR